jgi:hypothetical protein
MLNEKLHTATVLLFWACRRKKNAASGYSLQSVIARHKTISQKVVKPALK